MTTLVLTRREGETLCIGDDVRVTVIQTQRGQVKLAIEAPREVSVDRLEVRERKMTEVAA